MSRYAMQRELGRGGMGAVELVWDGVRGEAVARKRVLVPSGDAFVRLKREFRALAELSHPSLVSVFELARDDDGVFFTMEAIEGVDLYRHCRDEERGVSISDVRTIDAMAALSPTLPAVAGSSSERAAQGSLRLDRLSAVLPSLLEGLAYLHAQGLVHRDLKPSNVLVDREGRARILDFGILAELTVDHAAGKSEVAGTPAYMAPEQIRGIPASPASDLYALGVTLFEIAAGVPPFSGTVPAVLAAHLSAAPPDLRSMAPDVPPALSDAIAALLDKDPARRPSLVELSSRLGANIAPASVSADLVGRAELSARLAALGEQNFAALVLEGPSGVGKSALLRWTARAALSRGHLVLRGRARPSELLAFNAIDGVVDELAVALAQARSDPKLAHQVERASLAFPALGEPPLLEIDPRAARAIAFDALSSLLGALADRRGGVWVIVDDLQWADADSVAFLDVLLEAAPRRVRVVASARDDLSPTPASRWTAGGALERCAVPALDPEALAVIVERSSAGAIDAAAALALARACDGRAYFAEVAGRLAIDHPVADLAAGLAAQLASAGEPARRALSVLAAADDWIPVADVAQVLGASVGAIDGIARKLASLAIVRRSGAPGPDETLGIYHDVARTAVLDALGEGGLRSGHEGLAAMLERKPDAEPLRLIRHLAAAGRTNDAAARAAPEAERAERRQAFDLAAELWEIAAGSEGAIEARRRRATALIRAGRYADAAAVLGAIEASEPTSGVAFDRAYAHLSAGAVSEGLRVLNEVLARAGGSRLPGGFWSSVPGLLIEQLGPRKAPAARGPAPRSAADRERRERECEVALMLTWEEPLLALAWARRVRALGDREGRPERGAFAEYILAFMAAAGPEVGEPKLTARFLEAARHRAQEIADEPAIVALDAAIEALVCFRVGRFEEAALRFTAEAQRLEEAGRARTHSHLLLLSQACGSYVMGERPDLLCNALARFEAACPPEQGAMRAHTSVVAVTLAAMRGERERHRVLRDEQLANLAGPVRYHHVLARVMGAYGEILWSDPRELRVWLAKAMRDAGQFSPMRGYFAAGVCSMLALAEAGALRLGDRSASARRIEGWAKRARRSPPLFSGGAIRASAYAASARGDERLAVARLTEAESVATAHGQAMSYAIARYQRGLRVGGDEGAALVSDAERTLASVGAHRCVLDEDHGRRD